MPKGRTKRIATGLGDVAMQVRLANETVTASDVHAKRALLAEFCRLVGEARVVDRDAPVSSVAANEITSPENKLSDEIADLPPRQRQTLLALLDGDSEKQIALRLDLSPHTVHVYVKSLYRRFDVASRGELLSRWVIKSGR